MDVVIQGQVLLDLLEAGGIDQSGGVLLAVDDVLLQAGEHLREAHGGGVGAQHLVHADEHGGAHHADLQAGQVGGGADGVNAVGGAAGAVIGVAQADKAVAGDPLADLAAQVAVQGVKGALRILEQIGHIQHADLLVVGGQHGGGGQRHLDGAHGHSLAQLLVAAQLGVGIDLNVDAAVGLLLDLLLKLQQGLVGGAVLGLHVGHLQDDGGVAAAIVGGAAAAGSGRSLSAAAAGGQGEGSGQSQGKGKSFFHDSVPPCDRCDLEC